MPPCGIENGLWAKSIAFVFLVPFVEREVDDPAQLEAVAVDEVQFLAGAGAGRTGEARRISSGSPATKKAASPSAEAELVADRLGALLADVLGDRAGAFDLFAFLAPEDIAQPRLALALRPGVHAVAEGAAAAGLGRDRPDLGLRVVGQDAGEHLEAGIAEMLGDVLHLDRVAQVRLVGAVFAHRLVIGNARELLASPACRRQRSRTRRA